METTITIENIVDPQYATGVTIIHSFETDGTFEALPSTDILGGGRTLWGTCQFGLISQLVLSSDAVQSYQWCFSSLSLLVCFSLTGGAQKRRIEFIGDR